MLRLFSLLPLAFAVLLASTTAARAEDENWTVSSVAGAANVAAPAVPAHAVHKGDALAPGALLTTGSDGQVVFTDGKTVVTMSPNSRLTMPANPSDAMTRFSQDLGSVFFKVEKRPLQHFEVQTPLVAAVVKGTQFTVSAGATEHSVDVTEGLVEVVAMNGGQKEMVPAGRSAHVRTDAPTRLKLAGDPAGTGKVTRAIGAEPVDYAMVTNGLTTSAVTNPEGGSSESKDSTTAASGAVALLDGTTSTIVGSVADVGSGSGHASDGGSVGVGVNTGSGSSGGGGVGVGVTVGAGSGGTGTTVSVGLDTGSTGVGATVGVGVGSASTGVGATVGVGVDTGSTGVGATVGVGVGTGSTGAGATVGVGTGSTGTGATVGVGLGTGSAGVGVTVGVGTGGISIGLVGKGKGAGGGG